MAIANFRDVDGVTRPVKRFADSKTAAERKLKKALLDRKHRGGDELTRDSLFSECAEQWLRQVDRQQRGTTWDRARSKLQCRVLPAMGKLRLHECTTPRVDAFLEKLEETLKSNTVRGYRATISGVLSHAVRVGAIERNPVREAAPIKGRGKLSRALTREEREDLLAKVDADEVAREGDLPDVFRYLMGSGVRIGELMGLRWFRLDLDNGIAVHADNLVSETKRCLICRRVRRDHPGGRCPGANSQWSDPGRGDRKSVV